MIKKRKKRQLSYSQKRTLAGYLFSIPLIFGLLVIFIPSIYKTIVFSFNEVITGGFGYKMNFQGWKYYKEALFSDPQIIPGIISSLSTLLINIPIIIIFSLLIATLLNGKFRGRLPARLIFFLPVVLTTGIIVRFDTPLMQSVYSTVETDSGTVVSGMNEFTALLSSLNVGSDLVEIITSAVSNIYNVVTASGIQIFIFLAGLQEIPSSLYEAAAVEGCSKWETFWKITFPMIMPQTTINAVYTIVDSFTNDSAIFTYISNLSTQQQYSLATAASILYLICLAVVIAIVMGIIRVYTKHLS